ncbi:MAG TPA: hydroxymethylbilane synthase [Dissulfurispiraceae bacterium]|nr:hydroxymethylbilane synthase [Dissulfurispiraceae bacterium]
MKNKIIIGTRGSKLALWQAEWVKEELKKIHPGLDVDLIIIKTTGDKVLDVPLAQVGGKGLFVKEIEEAMLRGEAHIAVHSMKDVPTEFPEGLHLSVICKREDPRDVFIAPLREGKPVVSSFRELPHGAKIGTSSLRRATQLKSIRPDLVVEQLRGNVETRIRKMDSGMFDAVILAAAGVKRLGMQERITEILPLDISLSAIGQGAVGIECRTDDTETIAMLAPLNHHETSLCVRAERALLKRLDGGCQVPIAAHAEWDNGIIRLDGLVGSIDGATIVRSAASGTDADPESLGTSLAETLLAMGADEILAEVYGKIPPKGTI